MWVVMVLCVIMGELGCFSVFNIFGIFIVQNVFDEEGNFKNDYMELGVKKMLD